MNEIIFCRNCHRPKSREAFELLSTQHWTVSVCKDCRKRKRKRREDKYREIHAGDYVPSVTAKACSKCKIYKDASEYHRSRNRPDGLQASCKQCQIGMVKKTQENYVAKSIEVTPTTRKHCAQCKRSLQLKSFNKHPYGQFGRTPYCKKCKALNSSELRRKYKEEFENGLRTIPLTKRCCRCKISLDAKEFYPEPGNYDGLYPRCKSCEKKRQKAYGESRDKHESHGSPDPS